jgi:GR25 family glycosyltransferase involved in LPS biosynthesis
MLAKDKMKGSEVLITVLIVGCMLLISLLSWKYLCRKQTPHRRVTAEPYDFDFDKNTDLFYINLDRATGRRRNIEKQFKKQGLSAKRHPAVDGTKVDLEDPKYAKSLKHTKSWYTEDKKRMGHFACFLSHMEILEECLAKQSPYVVIFEDDAEFLGSDFKQKVYENMKNVPADWDIILFGYHVDDSNDLVKKGNKNSKVRDGIINLTYFTGLHGYVVRNKALRVMVDELYKHEWLLDWNMGYLAERGQLNIYGIFPPILCQPAAHRITLNGIDLKLNCSFKLGGMMDDKNISSTDAS